MSSTPIIIKITQNVATVVKVPTLSLPNIFVDGVTITGSGTPASPLIAIGGGGGSGGAAWGSITGSLSSQTDLQSVLSGKVAVNSAITGAIKTKITFDAKGLVVAGADATTADISDSNNKRYITDAQQTVLANTSGTNTGDNAVNSLYSGLVSNATHTGDATGATALTVVKINGVSMAGLATGILKNTTGTGAPSIAVAADFPTLNQNTTGNAANITGTAAIANGGTGQTTAQTAIDALTNVSAATNEYVLTKDTATGHAIFKAAAGGGGGGGTPKVTVLAQSSVAASVTGTTADTTLATYTLPANTLPSNGLLRITTLWSRGAAANAIMALKVKFGGTTISTVNMSAVASNHLQGHNLLWADNSVSAQKYCISSLAAPYSVSNAAIGALTVNTASNVAIDFAIALSNSADTGYLQGYTIEMLTP
jgi:hypothetical protein